MFKNKTILEEFRPIFATLVVKQSLQEVYWCFLIENKNTFADYKPVNQPWKFQLNGEQTKQ